jgi:flavocytochrome c
MSNLRLITAPCVGVLIIAVGLGLLVHSDLSSLPFTSSWTGKATNEKQKAMEGIGGNSDPTLVVVGSGFAGTTAALAAAQEDAALNIIMLEKEERTGGNSMKASSGINAVSIEHGDSIETFAKDTLASGGGLSDPALVQTLVNDSREALEWLASMGVDLNGTVQLGGHTTKRTHFPSTGPSVGFAILRALGEIVKQTPNIKVITSAKVVSLIKDNEKVTGVRYISKNEEEEVLLRADAVILASGGFGANKDLLRKHAPHLINLATTNGDFAQGEGLVLASEVGAALRDLDQVQVHPTGFVDPSDVHSQVKFLAPEKLRGVGGILLNSKGQRFVNELSTRDVVSSAILKLPEQTAFLLLGSTAAASFGPALGFYASKGLVKKFNDLNEAAEEFGVSSAELNAELMAYNTKAASADSDAFGKSVFPCQIDPNDTMYIARVVPVIHYTMGGARIDTEARVLGKDGQPITGLFGAGEVSGGVHGKNRLGGNSLLECCVFGRRAGKASAMSIASVKK